jgi:TRAP-type C4-dicarboxylate transport system substrate-binding protein
METYVANLEEASGGRLVVSLHPMGAIAPTTEEMDAVSSGNELMARALTEAYPNRTKHEHG